MKHIVEYGDAWMPIQGRFDIGEGWATIQRAAEDAGRDPSTIQLGVFGARPDQENLDQLQALGASWVALGLPAARSRSALATLDKYAPLVAAYNG